MSAPQFSDYEHYGDLALEEWAAALVKYIEELEQKLNCCQDPADCGERCGRA